MATVTDIIETKQFLERSLTRPIFDVRSPEEFHQGNIPGAFNVPLFSDVERAIVGTTYTHKGKEAAILKGLEMVGPKLEYFVKTALELAPNKEVLVHCWRGGMRSEAMAWLLQFSGIKTNILAGGYKAYRCYIHEAFTRGPEILVLGGMTGSGKTEMLQYLASQGEQVIDLERLANHKGSAFGALGQDEQSTNEQFENDFAAQWLKLDPAKPVWMEDESRNIGKVIIPEVIFEKMMKSKVIMIDIPFEERVKRLVEEYGAFDKPELAAILEKIRKRVGGDVVNESLNALNTGNIDLAISVILKYYDKTYQYGLMRRNPDSIIKTSYLDFQKKWHAIKSRAI
jgi:tRNA 2-selenouridine synthase